MADWFKIYENDIDEMRLQWAIGELPEVLPVWIVLLSEACRHKDGTLSGYCQDFELFGISKRVNVSVPKVNSAIELLIKISYLKRMEDKTLLIRKWDEKQSEYCQKKTRMQNQSGDNHHTKRTKKQDNVRIVSGQTPESVRQEERRGEEIRIEEVAVSASPQQLGSSKKLFGKKKALKLADEEFLEELKKLYPHLDVSTQINKMTAWLMTHPGRQLTRAFVVNWLNRIEAPLSVPKKPKSNFDPFDDVGNFNERQKDDANSQSN